MYLWNPPKAKFKGTLIGFDPNSTTQQIVTLNGDLSLHGKSKAVTTEAVLINKDGKLSLKGEFNVLVADFDIKIPRTVVDNIAKSIKISFDLEHAPYE